MENRAAPLPPRISRSTPGGKIWEQQGQLTLTKPLLPFVFSVYICFYLGKRKRNKAPANLPPRTTVVLKELKGYYGGDVINPEFTVSDDHYIIEEIPLDHEPHAQETSFFPIMTRPRLNCGYLLKSYAPLIKQQAS